MVSTSRASCCTMSKQSRNGTMPVPVLQRLFSACRKPGGADWQAVLAADLRMADQAEALYLTSDRERQRSS